MDHLSKWVQTETRAPYEIFSKGIHFGRDSLIR